MSDQYNNSKDKNESKNIEDWGRHFDTLLWTVTAIMAAAIGGLLVYVHNSINDGKKLDIFMVSSGYLLTLAAVYLAASFRQLRLRCQKHYTDKIRMILEEKRLFQWPIYTSIFVILEVLWLKLIFEYSIIYFTLCVIFVLVCGFIICRKIRKG